MYDSKFKFPRGYKTWWMLKMMKAMDGLTHGEIIKYAYEMNNGRGSFDKRNNRGYWSGAFVSGKSGYPWQISRSGYISKSPGPIYANCTKGEDGKWRVNDAGRAYIAYYDVKFSGFSHEDAKEMKKKSDAKKSERSTLVVEPSTPKEIEILSPEVPKQKPPIGVIPKKLFVEKLYKDAAIERLADIKRAMKEYMEANLKFPQEWVDEYESLILLTK